MPRVAQQHLDARRQQIIDAARARFARDGFARTSMPDIVAESGLSTGAIYRYFKSKDEIVAAVCAQSLEGRPAGLDLASVGEFLEHLRRLSIDRGHARLALQIQAEAALSPSLAEIVERSQQEHRDHVAGLIRAARADGRLGAGPDPDQHAEAYVGLLSGY